MQNDIASKRSLMLFHSRFVFQTKYAVKNRSISVFTGSESWYPPKSDENDTWSQLTSDTITNIIRIFQNNELMCNLLPCVLVSMIYFRF